MTNTANFGCAGTLCENTNFYVTWNTQNRRFCQHEGIVVWNIDLFFITTLLMSEQQCMFLKTKLLLPARTCAIFCSFSADITQERLLI